MTDDCEHEWSKQVWMGFGYVRECVRCHKRQTHEPGQVNMYAGWESE